MSRPDNDEIVYELRVREVEALERIADALEALWFKEQPGVKPATWVKARGETVRVSPPGRES